MLIVLLGSNSYNSDSRSSPKWIRHAKSISNPYLCLLYSFHIKLLIFKVEVLRRRVMLKCLNGKLFQKWIELWISMASEPHENSALKSKY